MIQKNAKIELDIFQEKEKVIIKISDNRYQYEVSKIVEDDNINELKNLAKDLEGAKDIKDVDIKEVKQAMQGNEIYLSIPKIKERMPDNVINIRNVFKERNYD